MQKQLHIAATLEELSNAVAAKMVEHITAVLREKDACSLVLSGGSTPRKLHELLASASYKRRIDWTRIHIYFGDERFVPLSDKRSNANMAFETLLNHVPVLPEHIHIMPTENIEPATAAVAYETLLRAQFHQPLVATDLPPQTFDLVLLGMGDDGHTLSLFPGKTEVIHETKKWCTQLWLQEQDMFRITLTHPVVNQAAAVFFLVSGEGKATALKQVLQGNYNPDQYPSQIIQPVNGELHWFVDQAAAKLLKL